MKRRRLSKKASKKAKTLSQSQKNAQRLLMHHKNNEATLRIAKEAARGMAESRKDAKKWIQAIDKQLVLAGLPGLQGFCRKKPWQPLGPDEHRYFVEDRHCPWDLPDNSNMVPQRSCIFNHLEDGQRFELPRSLPQVSLCMVADEGSDGFAASFALMGKLGLRGLFLMDPRHRTSNDVNFAFREEGRWGDILDSVLPMNLSFGPWHSEAWWYDLKNRVTQWKEEEAGDDPFFR